MIHGCYYIKFHFSRHQLRYTTTNQVRLLHEGETTLKQTMKRHERKAQYGRQNAGGGVEEGDIVAAEVKKCLSLTSLLVQNFQEVKSTNHLAENVNIYYISRNTTLCIKYPLQYSLRSAVFSKMSDVTECS